MLLSSTTVVPTDLDDPDLYARARALLEEMARVGNLSAKDHMSLLADVEDMVARCLAESRATTQVGTENMTLFDMQGVDNIFEPSFEGLIDEQVWHDLDWENLLRGWAEINYPG